MKTILKNKWHLHAPIGAVVMSVLLFLFTYSESLRYLETILVSLVFLAIGCFAFEMKQDWGKPDGDRQTNKQVLGDVLAGVFGGVFITIFNIQPHLTGNYTLQIVVLILLLSAGFGLEVYRRKRIKKDKLIS